MTKETESKYINRINRELNISDSDRKIFNEIIRLPIYEKENILNKISTLKNNTGLSYSLLALYRQQVNSGFVLEDPLETKRTSSKDFFDKETGITFNLQWNPGRELRRNHNLLIERGIITDDIDKSKLINKDKDGKACYLCKVNIDLQNPGEITLEIQLAGERYYIGVNFAYITNNHLTIMPEEHRHQNYNKNVIKKITDFLDKTVGYFRIIFNGLAGASILTHEHFQATTEKFPIEDIKIKNIDILFEEGELKILKPKYYIHVVLLEGRNKEKLIKFIDKILSKWHELDEENHTENIIGVKNNNIYRIFIFFRDKRKLSGAGRKGALAAFESGGIMVFSYKSLKGEVNQINEEETYQKASLGWIKEMLESVVPDEEMISKMVQNITFFKN